MFTIVAECSRCGEAFSCDKVLTVCTKCGGALLFRYDLAGVAEKFLGVSSRREMILFGSL